MSARFYGKRLVNQASETTLLRSGLRSTSEGTHAPPIVNEVLNSPGRPLDTRTRAFIEPQLGHDFSRVRVHADERAAESARAVRAHAYTVGRNIVFATGQYAPESKEGQVRLAHELTHVIQQERAGPPIQGAIRIGSPTSVLEREANSVATGISRGRVSRISDGQVAHLQRQGMGDVRVAEAEMEEQADADTSPIDGEFWALPPGVERDAVPVFDDEDTQAVVGFRTRGSVTKVYDLEGTLVDISEPGLEAPLIDPIDILAGGLVGLGRGLVRGGGRAAARGALARGGGAALGRAGLRAAIGTLSRRVITAIRGVYRAIRFRGLLNFTETAAARMADVARRVPQHILKLAIRFGTRSPDPQGVAGAFRYVIPMFRNGKEYMLEVVIREADKTVLHFLYR